MKIFSPLIYVLKKREGYGSCLIENARIYAHKAHCTLWVGTDRSNEVAIAFYNSLAPSWMEEAEGGEKRYAWKYNHQINYRPRNPDLPSTVGAIRKITNTPNLHWRVQRMNKSYDEVILNEGTLGKEGMFGIGGLTQVFVFYSLWILVHENPSRISMDDEISKHLGINLSPHKTTVGDLLQHTNSIKAMNDLLLGPDGTPLVSKEKQFLAVAENAFWFTPPEFTSNSTGNRLISWEPSDFNPILAGYIIEMISGLPIGEFIKQRLIVPLGLSHTCSTKEDFRRLKELIMPPHIVGTGEQVVQTTPCDYFDGPLFAAMGMYSSADDLTTFLTTLIRPSAKGFEGFDQMKFFAPIVDLKKEGDIRYSCFGYCLPLDEIGHDLTSLNAVVSPSAAYSLGTRPVQSKKAQNLRIYHVHGTVNGYTADAYIELQTRMVIAVVGNASGLVDVSDHVSRAIIQNKFGFQDSEGKEVEILERVKIGIQEAKDRYKSDTPTPNLTKAGYLLEKFPGLNGLFTDEKQKQSLHIVKKEDHYEFAVAGNGSQSKWFWLFPDEDRDDSIWIRPQPPEDIATMGIDTLHSWFPPSIRIPSTNEGIKTLTRESRYGTLEYVRVE
jgi:CubicO group peptidase (beta-lactamase class C family)